MVDLIALQARDCGMDLESLLIDNYGDLVTYPHELPGTTTPFDLLFIGLGSDIDPGNAMGVYASSEVSDEEHPDAYNIGGFSDPAFDRLIESAKTSYDQAERVRLYRQAQEELAAQLPALFLWHMAITGAVRPTVATVAGPLDLTVPSWSWAPERLVVVANP
jgi:ABC-type transport system substrate-binding protein